MTGFLLSSSFGKAFLSKKKFDANGKSYNDGIPAIKRYSAGVASTSSNISDDMVHAGGDIPATVFYNSNNSDINSIFKALKAEIFFVR